MHIYVHAWIFLFFRSSASRPGFFIKKYLAVLKKFAGTEEIFAGTNTSKSSDITLFLVIYTEISNIS